MALLALLLEALTGSPAIAHSASSSSHGLRPGDAGSLTIKLLEAPINRRDDPRAAVFIVDHVNPGTRFSRRLEIISSSPKPHHVELYAAGAGIRNGKFTFAPDHTANELSSWITLDRSDLQLRPHGSATVKATVNVPQWAPKGERYAVIWAQVSSPSPGPEGNIALVNRVGIRAYLDVGPGGEPPSDFRVAAIVPQRTDDGQPKVVATVINTGQRALDLDGQLSLFDGPDSLSAGPFPAVRGTTLAPGNRGNVAVLLGEQLPDGPWKFRLSLRSGRVKHAVTGTLTFPKKSGAWGLPASVDSSLTLILTIVGLLVLVVVVLIAFGARRFRVRQRAAVPDSQAQS